MSAAKLLCSLLVATQMFVGGVLMYAGDEFRSSVSLLGAVIAFVGFAIVDAIEEKR